ncbi:MAG TPA: HAMP domain-containing sensor histidine kinase [Candidatus Angelobacter sp.]
MTELSAKIPPILTLAVLVGIFVALRRHMKSSRLNLWTAAWLLIFIHFFVEAFQQRTGIWGHALDIMDLGSLQVSATLFVASLTSFVEDKSRTWTLLALTALPILVYTSANVIATDNSQYRPLYTICLAIVFFGTVGFLLLRRKVTPVMLAWTPILVLTGVWAIYKVWHNDPDTGFNATLTLGFGAPAFLFWRRYRRWSPGVITSAGGFLLWGLVFPVGVLTDIYFPNAHINPEIWNVPKFFVAFGMILTVLEEKSDVLAVTSLREHKLNEQLQKFASITSRLLTGVEVNSLCGEIAHAITETSNFRRAIILLGTDDKGMYLAGHSGLSPDNVVQLKKFTPRWRITDVTEVCRSGSKIGANSYLMSPEQVEKYTPLRESGEIAPNPYWKQGSRVVVPLQSTHGTYVGCITLDGPHDVAKVTAEEMSKIELLGGDLAVTIGNTTLHRQLLRSEKLAAIGQLVAGVAHELNNPLASIVGYSELMQDEVPAGPARQKLEKLSREAQRMKRIIENLLRFARQNNLERKSANLEPLLQEVLSLREYQIRTNDVEVKLEIEPNLPQVALDEDQFKQILLNLLNNSMDALEFAEQKSICISASRQGDRVFVRFEDSGAGFADVNRAFDPFYTTKPVGKGTGLGLSICYGIVKEHGGEIHAVNIEPNGARIVLELPITEPVAVAATAR